MKDTLHVKGLAELDRKLGQFPVRVRRNVLRASLRAGGAVIGREARKVARRVWPQASRLTRTSGIAWRVSRIRGDTARVKVSWTTDRSRPKASTGAPWYAHFLELGTKYIRARPFLRVAWTAKYLEALEAFKQRLAKGIEDEARKMR